MEFLEKIYVIKIPNHITKYKVSDKIKIINVKAPKEVKLYVSVFFK